MPNLTKEAFSEVYDIIYNIGIYNEIPKSFIELIDSIRDKNYKVNIDYTQNLNKQELQEGTKVILSLIYRDYLCSQEERQVLIQKDKEELKEYENNLREKYNSDEIFKKQEELRNTENVSKELAITEYKDSIFKRLINKIKRFFNLI